MKAIHKRRLLKCAQIVAKAHRYDQTSYAGKCAMCALAHYDRAVDRQDSPEKHFGLNSYEYCELFSTCGCGEAKTGKQAAAYIRAFVKSKK